MTKHVTDFTELVDLAAERLGGSVLYANDDFFASKDNLLKAQPAIFIDGKYTDRGKWMDGWESRRRRIPGHDFCIVRLGLSGVVRGVVVDTAFFKGNYPAGCSIEAASVPGDPDVETLLSDAITWTEILPESNLQGDSKNPFEIKAGERFTHLRFHIYPDGGVARLRVHGDVVPHAKWVGRTGQLVDLASVEHGAVVVACNDMFFGSRHNLIMPGRGVNMGDGWETKRSRREGPDWVMLKLAGEGTIERAIVDTLHFKGNFPESCSLEVCNAGDKDPSKLPETAWIPLLARTKLQAHTAHTFDDVLLAHPAATHVRLRIWPDGGVSRLRLFGTVTPQGREANGLRYLNSLPKADAVKALQACCGSSAWSATMASSRPFASLDAAKKKGHEIWSSLTKADYDEAFRAHPRIGEKKAEATQSAEAKKWSAGEQSKLSEADATVLAALKKANEDYEKKFGRIYIVCATGKTAKEMLEIAQTRLSNDADSELAQAAGEQGKITDLRLEKLILQ